MDEGDAKEARQLPREESGEERAEPTKIFLPCLSLTATGPLSAVAIKDKAQAGWREKHEGVCPCETHLPLVSSSLLPHLYSLSHSLDLREAASVDQCPRWVCA